MGIRQMSVTATTIDAIRRALARQGLDAEKVDDAPALQAAVRTTTAEFFCQAWWLDEVERFVFYAVAPVPAPLDQADPVMRYITRINAGLSVGNFELDLDDGGVRMKTAVAVDAEHLTDQVIERQVATAITAMDHFLPGLLRVAFGDSDPDVEALAAVSFGSEAPSTV